MAKILQVLCVAVIVLNVSLCRADYESRARLLHDLMSSYTTILRPPAPPGGQVVNLGISLIRAEPDVETDRMDVNVWIKMLWTDLRLSWDPELYGDVSYIHIPAKLLWRPDIRLYNQVDPMWIDEDLNAVVYNNGEVFWVPPAKVSLNCLFYDGSCSAYMKMGSWTYSGYEIDLAFLNNVEDVSMDDFFLSNNYEITTNARKNVKFYPCCEEPYPDLTFEITAVGRA